ncbi:MAG TPA: glycosyltransferase family 4 protein [Nitrolancea sp.]
MPVERARRVLMLGTFGLRPKATLRARALAMARSLPADAWTFNLITTPWDCRDDAGKRWCEYGVSIHNTRTISPTAAPLVTLETMREVRKLRPDIIHLFKPKGFGDISARALRQKLPVVVDMDDWEGDGGWNEIGGYSGIQRRLFDWQERTWPRQAAALTVASRELERRALDLGANRQRVHYVPNGLTRARCSQLASLKRRPRGEVDRPPTILLYTRFVEFEPEFIVRVLVDVRKAIPDAIVRIAGASADGRAEIVLRESARDAGVAGAIDLRGWVGPDDIPELAAVCDLAIHPFDDSLVNRSKCSVKLLELMATGIPIVTTAVGENASFIEDGASGRLTPPGEPSAMANAIVELMRHPAHAELLGRAAHERVNAHYLWEQLAPRVAAAYRQALDERANRSPNH